MVGHGLMRELEWLSSFSRRHPRVKPPISSARLALLMSQWYHCRYVTVARYAVEEFTVQGEEHTFQWKHVPIEWLLDHFLAIDYLYANEHGDLIGLDVTVDDSRVATKCKKHFSLKGIFDHLGITPFVLVIGNSHENDSTDTNDPTAEGYTNYM